MNFGIDNVLNDTTFGVSNKELEPMVKELKASLDKKRNIKKDKIIIDSFDDDFGAVLNCAIRYSLGRQTYMPGLVIGFINPLLSQLNDKTLYCMEKDILEADSYGDEYIDKLQWIWFLNNIRAEIKERKKKDND